MLGCGWGELSGRRCHRIDRRALHPRTLYLNRTIGELAEAMRAQESGRIV